MSALDIDLTAGAMHVEAKIVIAQRKEQVAGEPCKQIAAGVVCRADEAQRSRSRHSRASLFRRQQTGTGRL
jgi:hypothetical protein